MKGESFKRGLRDGVPIGLGYFAVIKIHCFFLYARKTVDFLRKSGKIVKYY